MVRLRVPAVAAAAVVALVGCSSLGGGYPQPDKTATAIDYGLFPPPPPMPPEHSVGPAAGAGKAHEIARLAAAIEQLSDDIEASRRHLAALDAELERTRTRLERLLDSAATVGAEARRPLVRIRYDQPEADHAGGVRAAIGAALARLPDAAFDLVTVTPDPERARADAGAIASVQARAEEVMATLLEMGLPAHRLTLSSAHDSRTGVAEVRIYIR